jgi:hypothetical protein
MISSIVIVAKSFGSAKIATQQSKQAVKNNIPEKCSKSKKYLLPVTTNVQLYIYMQSLQILHSF